MKIAFYNVKKRKKVNIDGSKVKKEKFEPKPGQFRYAMKAVDDEGTKLTKFCSKLDFDAL